MSGSNNSGSGTGKMAVPQAKEAMNRFKQEVASEIGVPLKEGYNGDLTSAQAGRTDEKLAIRKKPLHIFGNCQRYAVAFYVM